MINISLEDKALKEGELIYKHLLGRKFQLGKEDCYDMLCCMFQDNLGITLTDYSRPKDFWNYNDINIYVDNYRREGFIPINSDDVRDYRPFDVFLIAIPDPTSKIDPVTNHCAIYLKDGYIIHHRYGEFSKIELYKGALKNLTTHHIRHTSVPDLRPTGGDETIDIMDYILPHKRVKLEESYDKYKQAVRESGKDSDDFLP